jgi:hypothetical protein
MRPDSKAGGELFFANREHVVRQIMNLAIRHPLEFGRVELVSARLDLSGYRHLAITLFVLSLYCGEKC